MHSFSISNTLHRRRNITPVSILLPKRRFGNSSERSQFKRRSEVVLLADYDDPPTLIKRPQSGCVPPGLAFLAFSGEVLEVVSSVRLQNDDRILLTQEKCLYCKSCNNPNVNVTSLQGLRDQTTNLLINGQALCVLSTSRPLLLFESEASHLSLQLVRLLSQRRREAVVLARVLCSSKRTVYFTTIYIYIHHIT